MQVFCGYPFTRVRVTAEGNVAMCCFQRPDPLKPDIAYLGNLLKDSFDEIWFSELAEDIRNTTMKGELADLCRVPGCPYLSMRKPYPTHHVIYNEYPTFLEIDLPNTHCNVGGTTPSEKNPACIMCERASPHFVPEVDKLADVIPRLINIVPNLTQIHIQGIAEPFYKDLLFNLLDWLEFDKYKDRITISTTTNGTLFKPEVREKFLQRCPHSITNFSIDAATPETFKKIRIFDCFERVLENMYSFNKERIRPRQFLRICNNINTMNIHEAVAMVQIAANADAEYIEFNPTDGFNREILVNEQNCGMFKKAQDDIIRECERLGVPYNFIRPLDLGLTDQLIQITL